MKRITEYKKLFNVEDEISLKTLKTTYRNLVKEWHPDKFQEGDEKVVEAETISRKVIDGYHFLVSIAPETKAANLEDYNITISESGIADYKLKGLMLEISFLDGTTYEYFGVSKNVFTKFNNSDKQFRFAKRNIFNSFLYRKSKGLKDE
ncbi:MAG: molecular chaperone DnaJ [Flavobacteriales bacterium CG_4_9_14_3_um_filter_32_8]|nr:MAG: molecular chaperone DnaJ [Flavobacteriales bacterium CG_4_9_14_3_um_filter_32_8]